jgi:ATP-dependent protease HslVU (ClpYQ) peptidase subunit
MTCIIGLIDNGKVYMGADSAGSDGYTIGAYKAPKTWKHTCTAGEFLFAASGSFMVMQALRHCFDPPCVKEGQELNDYMIREFLPAFRKVLEGLGVKGDEKGEPNMARAGVLVGFRGRLWWIASNFAILESNRDYLADGSGMYHAMGCLYGTKGMEPKDRILKALECAENHIATVRGPFTIVETDTKEGGE